MRGVLVVMRLLLLFALLLQDDDVAKLVNRLAGDDADDVKAAQAELVKKGKDAKTPVQKALAVATRDLKERYEGVLLRIEGGADDTSAKLSEVPVTVEATWTLETAGEGAPAAAKGKKWGHIHAYFQADNQTDSDKVLVIVSAKLITLKDQTKLIVEGPKKEPFQWTLLARKLKSPAYDNLVEPKWPAGTRAIIVFEVKIGDATAKIRTGVFELTEKK